MPRSAAKSKTKTLITLKSNTRARTKRLNPEEITTANFIDADSQGMQVTWRCCVYLHDSSGESLVGVAVDVSEGSVEGLNQDQSAGQAPYN